MEFKKFKKLIKNKTVYLTFDVDGLDSSIMPATGHQNLVDYCGMKL